MRRLTHWQRKLIGLVATLVILSALLGDTEATNAAAATSESTHATSAAPGCGTGFARLLPGAGGTVSWTAGATSDLGVNRMQRSLAGVPPWVIWPPSPVPRVAGVMLNQPAARNRVTASAPLSADGWGSFDPAASNAGRNGLVAAWPEPFCPRDQLPGVSQRFPRPPPR
jgi:hypothetical protein